MNVQMRHAFARVRSAVDDNAIPGLLDVELFFELARKQQQFSENGALGFSGDGQTGARLLGNDQHANRRMRIYIMESNRVVVFPNNLRRNLTRDNFFEDRHGKWSD